MKAVMKPTSVIKARLGFDPNGPVSNFFTATCAKHMDPYVPMRKGNLADYRIDGNLIIYSQPYAKYQYRGMREDGSHVIKKYSEEKHANAGSYWDKRMVSAEMDTVVKEVQDFMEGK